MMTGTRPDWAKLRDAIRERVSRMKPRFAVATTGLHLTTLFDAESLAGAFVRQAARKWRGTPDAALTLPVPAT